MLWYRVVPRHTQRTARTAGRDFDDPLPTLESLDYRIRSPTSAAGLDEVAMSARLRARTRKALRSLKKDVTALSRIADRAESISKNMDSLGIEASECMDALSQLAIYLPRLDIVLIRMEFPDLQAAGITAMPEQGCYRAESDSRPGEFYNIRQDVSEGGEVFYHCDCPAGVWGKPCKHTKRLIALLPRG